jgi:dynein heavy chain
MTEALATFVKTAIEEKYVKSLPFNFPAAYVDAKPEVPMFFVLSPGVDPVKPVEEYGKTLGMSADLGKFSNVSLGQGQEPVAERAVESGHRSGNWVFLQNIHLTPNWTGGKTGYRSHTRAHAHARTNTRRETADAHARRLGCALARTRLSTREYRLSALLLTTGTK